MHLIAFYMVIAN